MDKNKEIEIIYNPKNGEMKNLKIRIKQYFNSYPKVEKLLFTGDGCCFLDEDLALEHAEKKDIAAYVVNRKDKQLVLLTEKGEDYTSEDAELELIELDLGAENLNEVLVLKIAKALNIECEEKEAYVQALSEHKAQLLNLETED